jgi:hypothetical protein
MTAGGHRIDFVPTHPDDVDRGFLLAVTGPDGAHVGYFDSVLDLRRAIDLSNLQVVDDADP